LVGNTDISVRNFRVAGDTGSISEQVATDFWQDVVTYNPVFREPAWRQPTGGCSAGGKSTMTVTRMTRTFILGKLQVASGMGQIA